MADGRPRRAGVPPPLGGGDSEAAPLYRQIHEELRERIRSGRYKVSSVLPTEEQLCAEFGVSRYTVREALRRLTEGGYVQRKQKSGTIVLANQPQVTYTQAVRSIEDLFQIAAQTHFVLLTTEKVTVEGALARQVGAASGEQWLRVTGVRWDRPGGTTICYVQSFVPRRYAKVVAGFADVKGPFYAVLEKFSGEPIEEIVQEIDAVAMPDAVARPLGLEAGTLSLRLLRRYTTKSGTLIASFNWHRADRFTYTMQLHRRSGPGAAAKPQAGKGGAKQRKR